MYEYHLVVLVFWFMSCGVTELPWCSPFPLNVATYTHTHTHHQTLRPLGAQNNNKPKIPIMKSSNLVLKVTWGWGNSVFQLCFCCCPLGVDEGATKSSISYMEEMRYCPIFPWLFPLMPDVLKGLSSYKGRFFHSFLIYCNFFHFFWFELTPSCNISLYLGLCFRGGLFVSIFSGLSPPSHFFLLLSFGLLESSTVAFLAKYS